MPAIYSSAVADMRGVQGHPCFLEGLPAKIVCITSPSAGFQPRNGGTLDITVALVDILDGRAYRLNDGHPGNVRGVGSKIGTKVEPHQFALE